MPDTEAQDWAELLAAPQGKSEAEDWASILTAPAQAAPRQRPRYEKEYPVGSAAWQVQNAASSLPAPAFNEGEPPPEAPGRPLFGDPAFVRQQPDRTFLQNVAAGARQTTAENPIVSRFAEDFPGVAKWQAKTQEEARYEPAGGVGGFIGSTAAGLASPTPENIMFAGAGGAFGAGAMKLAAPVLARIEGAAGTQIARVVEHTIGSGATGATISGLGEANRITDKEWREDPWGSMARVSKAASEGAVAFGVMGAAHGAIGRGERGAAPVLDRADQKPEGQGKDASPHQKDATADQQGTGVADVHEPESIPPALAKYMQEAKESIARGEEPTPIPESPATQKAQVERLADGRKAAILVTPGEAMPDVPEGMKQVRTRVGLFIYDPERITPGQLREAVRNDTIGEVLGYGIPAKPPSEAMLGAVTVRDPQGVEVQSVITDEAHLQRVHEAAQAIANPGDTIALEDPMRVISDRVEAGAKTQDEARALAEQLRLGELVPTRVRAVKKPVGQQRPNHESSKNRATGNELRSDLGIHAESIATERAPEPRPAEPAPAPGEPPHEEVQGQEARQAQGLLNEPTPAPAETGAGDFARLRDEAMDIADQANLIREERLWRKAIETPGSVVTHDKGAFVGEGKIIDPAKDAKHGRVLVEHQMDGRTAQRWYDPLDLSPQEPSGPIARIGPKAPTPAVAETPAGGSRQPWEMTADQFRDANRDAYTERLTTYRGDAYRTGKTQHIRQPGEAIPAVGNTSSKARLPIDAKVGDVVQGVSGKHRVVSVGKVVGGDRVLPDLMAVYKAATADHRAAVESALREGKPVPPEVLRDYPDLAKSAKEATPAPQAPRPAESEKGNQQVAATSAEAHGGEITKPKPFTRADLEARIVREYERSPRYESEKAQEDIDLAKSGQVNQGDVSGFFNFREDTLPADLVDATDGRPELRRLFKTGVRGADAIGSDQLAQLGAERYVKIAERRMRIRNEAKLGEALSALRRDADQNPQGAFLAQLHDNLPARSGRAKEAIDPADLKTGAKFTINGHEFRVTEEASGYRVLRDGEDFDPVPVDALDAVPVDKGSLKQAGAIDSIAGKAESIAAAAKERIKSRAVKPGRAAGGTTIFADTVDAGIYAAAKAVSLGIKGGKLLGKEAKRFTELVKRAVLEAAPHLYENEGWRKVRLIAKGILDDAGVTGPGRYDSASFDRAVADARAIKTSAGRQSLRARRDSIIASTGQAKPAKTVSEPQALEAGLRKSQRAALKAYKLGQQDAIAEARRKTAAAMEKMRTRQASVDGARREVRQWVQELLPTRLRGGFLTDVDNARTALSVQRTMARIVRTLAEDSAKSDAERVQALAGASRAQSLSLPRRDAVRQIAQWVKDERATMTPGPRWEDAQRLSASADRIRQWREVVQKIHKDQKAETAATALEFASKSKDAREGIIKNLDTVKDLNKPGEPEDREPNRLKRWMFQGDNFKTWAVRLDRGKETGPAQDIVSKGYEAHDRALSRYFKDYDAVEAIVKKNGYDSLADWYAKWTGSLGKANTDRVPVKMGGYEPAKGHAASLIAADPETRARFSDGAALNYESAPRETPFKVDNNTRDAIEKSMDPRDLAIIEGLKGLVSKDFDAAHDVTLKLLGHAPDKVKDYNPISINRLQSEDASLPPGYRSAIHHAERAGYMKARVDNTTTMKLRSFPDVVLDHLWSKAHLIEMAPYVRAAESVIMHPDVMQTITRKYGAQSHRTMTKFLQEFSGIDHSPHSDFDRLAARVISNVSGAAVALNPSTWAKQMTGIFRLRQAMGTEAWARGIASMFSDDVTNKLHSNPRFRERYQSAPYLQFTQAEEANAQALNPAQFLGNVKAAARSLKDLDIRDAGTNLADSVKAVKLGNWFDALPARVALGGLPEAKAVEAFWDTQNTGGAFDSSGFRVRGRDSVLAKAWQVFTSDTDKQYNMLRQAWMRGGKEFAGTAFDVALSILTSRAVQLGTAAAIGGAMVAGKKPAQKEIDRYESNLAWNAAQDAASMAVPGGGRVVGVIQALANKWDGAGMSTPIQDIGTQIAEAAQEIYQAATTQPKHVTRRTVTDEEHYRRAGLKLLDALGRLAGQPFGPIAHLVEKFRQGMKGE